MKKFFIVVSLLSIASQGFAYDDGEHMEVSAPNECCQIPQELVMLTGWVGASSMGGAATLKEAALKAAAKKAAQQKSKKQEKKEEEQQEENEFQQFTENNPGALSVLFHEIGLTLRQLLANGLDYKVKIKDADGNETTIEDCQPSGPWNPDKHTCTKEKFELFIDPTDGAARWAFTFAVVEAAYNPIHLESDAQGYYPKVVEMQSFTLVFDTEAELIEQLKQIAAAR